MFTPHHTLTVDDDNCLDEQWETFPLCNGRVTAFMLAEVANIYADKNSEAEAF